MPKKEPSPLPSQPRRGTETRGDDLTQKRAKPALESAPPQRAGHARNRYREDDDPSGWAGGESNKSIAKRTKTEKKPAIERSRPARKDSPRSDDESGTPGEGERWYGRGWGGPQKGLPKPKPAAKRRR